MTTALTTSGAAAINILPVCSQPNFQNTDICKSNAEQNQTHGQSPVIKALRITVSIMSFVIGFSAVIMLIVGGIRMATSGGDPQGAASARSTVIYALVGLIIAALAETIVAFVLSRI